LSDAVIVNPNVPTQQNASTVDGALYSPLGSLGNYVWKDKDDDGVQDVGEQGVDGVIVWLYKDGSTTPFAKDTTSSGGLYSFVNLPKGAYQVKIVGGVPSDCQPSAKQNVTGVGITDANDNDFDGTGASKVVNIDPASTLPNGKDNPNVDAALIPTCPTTPKCVPFTIKKVRVK
jgi:SdrD B-like domain